MGMIDKAAIALHDAYYYDLGFADVLPTWEKFPPKLQEKFRRFARAVIKAIREPTEEMVAEGEKEFFEHLPDAREWTLLYTKEAYQSMIDEALK